MKKFKKYYPIIIGVIAIVVVILSRIEAANEASQTTAATTAVTTQAATTVTTTQATTQATKTKAATTVTPTYSTIDPETLAVMPDIDLKDIPKYTGDPYVEINDNIPFFTEDDLTTESFEYYSPLDSLKRCSVCVANIGTDIMPTEERGSIGSVKPSGWKTVKYAGLVDGNYLYNRCHLIGFQLAGENANKKNLITGTRYLNVTGMLPFENMVADYVHDTDNHVLYRVSPIFDGDNLVASGVLMEAYSVEDDGEEVCFNIYCYNVQPGVIIDYATGDSKLE